MDAMWCQTVLDQHAISYQFQKYDIAARYEPGPLAHTPNASELGAN